MADFTLIRPANDAVALELSNWCSNLIPEISRVHTISRDLYGPGATRASAASGLTGPRCVLFFGHGRDAELMGAGGPLVDTANVGWASGAIIVAIACLSSKVLGPDAIHQGVDGYLGFRERFVWISRDPEGQFEPAATAGIHELLNGNDLDVALHAMQTSFDAVVQFYLNGAGKSSPNRALGWLSAFWDAQYASIDGHRYARL